MRRFDRSDARGDERGSGVGFAPTPSDSRDAGGDAEAPALAIKDRGGVSPAIFSFAAHAKETDRNVARNEDGDALSGAQQGSPAFMYPLETRTGMQRVDLSPIDGGMVDPIRRGDTPARRPFSRFLITTSKWFEDMVGNFSTKDRDFAGEDNGGPKASQPVGRSNPMDEYRRLYDGSHA